MIFKRGGAPQELEAAIEGAAGADEEKGAALPARVDDNQVSEKEKAKAAEGLQAASDIFTWRNVRIPRVF